MTDTELYSQILMFGWAGAEPPELLYQWVERGLGSVKVFGWNTEDIKLVAKSISSLQQKAGHNRFQIPLFVATDQEGGWIRHVKGDTTITPGNMALGASGYPYDTWYTAYYISREIKALGINMNFAPTVDLFTDHESAIIGTRSFGKGSVQTVIPLKDYGAMRVTTARYYTPSGRSIQAKGIEPDIEVKPAKVEEVESYALTLSEAELSNALKNENADDAKNQKKNKKSKEDMEDYQLIRALDLVKALALYSKSGK
jgi:hypothetical protein